MPVETKNATHVYIKLDKPDNLGQKFMGPFPIIDRPSNTTITVRVGYNRHGLPRLEQHHWNRVHIAYMRPEAHEAEKQVLGRPRRTTDKDKLAPRALSLRIVSASQRGLQQQQQNWQCIYIERNILLTMLLLL